MAKLIQQFNARNFDPEQGSGGFPIGNHLVKAISSEVKGTKAGDGGYLQFNAQILEGEHAGTTGAFRLNLYSSSPEAAKIAHGQFSALCHVTGVLDVQDSAQLHEIPFRIEVGLQKEPNPNKYTEVKKFYDVNGNAPNKNGQPAGGQQNNGGFGGQQQNGGGNVTQGNFGGQQQGGNNGGNMGNGSGGNQGGNGGQWGGNNGGGVDNGNGNGNQQGGNGNGQSWGNGANGGGNGGGNGNGGQWGNQGGQQNGGGNNGNQSGNQGNSWGNAANNGNGNGGQWGARQ